MRTWVISAAMALGLFSTGCAGASLVSARAADELRCPASEISVTSRDMGAYDARGCGKQASYVVRGGEVMPDTGGQDDMPSKMPKGED